MTKTSDDLMAERDALLVRVDEQATIISRMMTQLGELMAVAPTPAPVVRCGLVLPHCPPCPDAVTGVSNLGHQRCRMHGGGMP